VDNLLLHSTGYIFDTFMEQTKGSLRNFFYDEEDILEREHFLQLHGTGEAQIITADGTVNNVRLCKEDATDLGYVRTGQLGSCKFGTAQ
jgi:hypothetical protein